MLYRDASKCVSIIYGLFHKLLHGLKYLLFLSQFQMILVRSFNDLLIYSLAYEQNLYDVWFNQILG
jgi:hypothetical protein